MALVNNEIASSLMLSEEKYKQLTEVFHLLGEVGRLKMVVYCLHGPKSVNELALHAKLSQSLASHHLRHLRDARILKSKREGKCIYYDLDDEHIKCVLEDMLVHIQEND